MRPSALAKKITVTVPTDTRVSIAVSDGDAKEAARVANSLRQVAAEKIISCYKSSEREQHWKSRGTNSPSSVPNIKPQYLNWFLNWRSLDFNGYYYR